MHQWQRKLPCCLPSHTTSRFPLFYAQSLRYSSIFKNKTTSTSCTTNSKPEPCTTSNNQLLPYSTTSDSKTKTTSQNTTTTPHEDMKNLGHKAVLRALMGNTLITGLKFGCYFMTGSVGILAEAFHTLVDSINQSLLWVGLRQATASADQKHQYGYGRLAYFWSLVSAMGVFFIGSMLSFGTGFYHLVSPPTEVDFGLICWATLGISFVIDGGVLLGVLKDIKEKKPKDVSFFQHLRSINDVFVMAVLLEDLAACVGVGIAAMGILLSQYTGNTIFDGIASILIGVLLGGVSVTLVKMNQSFLTGRAVDPQIEQGILEILKDIDSVESVYDIKSQMLGPDAFSVKLEIDFSGHYFCKRLLEQGYEAQFDIVLSQSSEKEERKQMYLLLDMYTEDVTRMLESEIRHIENCIRKIYPAAVFIDIESASPITSLKLSNLLASQRKQE